MELTGVRYKRVLVALLLLAVVMLALVMLINYLPTAGEPVSGMPLMRSLEAAAAPETFRFDVPPDSGGITFMLDITLSAGSVVWAVSDPAGTAQAEGAISTGEPRSVVYAFDPVPGIWQVTVEPQAATGEYTLLWWDGS